MGQACVTSRKRPSVQYTAEQKEKVRRVLKPFFDRGMNEHGVISLSDHFKSCQELHDALNINTKGIDVGPVDKQSLAAIHKRYNVGKTGSLTRDEFYDGFLTDMQEGGLEYTLVVNQLFERNRAQLKILNSWEDYDPTEKIYANLSRLEDKLSAAKQHKAEVTKRRRESQVKEQKARNRAIAMEKEMRVARAEGATSEEKRCVAIQLAKARKEEHECENKTIELEREEDTCLREESELLSERVKLLQFAAKTQEHKEHEAEQKVLNLQRAIDEAIADNMESKTFTKSRVLEKRIREAKKSGSVDREQELEEERNKVFAQEVAAGGAETEKVKELMDQLEQAQLAEKSAANKVKIAEAREEATMAEEVAVMKEEQEVLKEIEEELNLEAKEYTAEEADAQRDIDESNALLEQERAKAEPDVEKIRTLQKDLLMAQGQKQEAMDHKMEVEAQLNDTTAKEAALEVQEHHLEETKEQLHEEIHKKEALFEEEEEEQENFEKRTHHWWQLRHQVRKLVGKTKAQKAKKKAKKKKKPEFKKNETTPF